MFIKFKLIFYIPLFLFAVAQAQDYSIGVRAGANYSKFSGSDDFFAGPMAGFFFHYKFDKIWSLQTELAYSQRGGKNSYEVYEYYEQYMYTFHLKINDTYKLHYLDFSILAKYNFNKQVNFFTGLMLGNFVSAEHELKVIDIPTGNEFTEYQSVKDIANTYFGLPFGVEYRFRSGIAFEMRYTLEFVSLYEGASAKSKNLTFSGSYYF